MSSKVGSNGNIKTLQKDSINRNNTFSNTEEDYNKTIGSIKTFSCICVTY